MNGKSRRGWAPGPDPHPLWTWGWAHFSPAFVCEETGTLLADTSWASGPVLSIVIPEEEMGAKGSVPVWVEAEAALDSWALVNGFLV